MLDRKQSKYQGCQHPAKTKTPFQVFTQPRKKQELGTSISQTIQTRSKPWPSGPEKTGRDTDLEAQKQAPRMFSALPLHGRTWPAGNSPQIPSPTTQQGSHRHPNYAPLRESRARVVIHHRLAELSGGASAGSWQSRFSTGSVPVLPSSSSCNAPTELFSFPTAGVNHRGSEGVCVCLCARARGGVQPPLV